MDGILLFATQFVIGHLLLGSLLVLAVSLSIRFLRLNAASRHRVWLVASALLILVPLFSVLPGNRNQDAHVSFEFIANTNDVPASINSSNHSSNTTTNVRLSSELSYFPADSSLTEEIYSVAELLSVRKFSEFLNSLPLFRLSAIALLFLYGCIVFLKFGMYLQSLQSLQRLIDSSGQVDKRWKQLLDRSTQHMGVTRSVELRESNEVLSPSTCGIFRPYIVLPIEMSRSNLFPSSNIQILEHELAHIKRNDMLIAGILSVASIFFFWQPFLQYMNNRIRLEREVACDDCVVLQNTQDDDSKIKAYAAHIVDFAESIRKDFNFVHSVGCASTGDSLRYRIDLLLDPEADHSNSIGFAPNIFGVTIAAAIFYVSASIFPVLPEDMFQWQESEDYLEPPSIQLAFSTLLTDDSTRSVSFSLKPNRPALLEPRLTNYDTPLKLADLDSMYGRNEKPVSALSLRSNEYSFEGHSSLATSDITPLIEVNVLQKASLLAAPNTADTIEEISSLENFAPHTAQSEPSEFIFIDRLSRSELESEMLKIELELYRVFNQLTEADQLKMYCDVSAQLGSHIKRLSCQPEFLRTAHSENVRDASRTTGFYRTANQLQRDLQGNYEELASQLVAEMQNNSYLRELYRVLVDLRERYIEIA